VFYARQHVMLIARTSYRNSVRPSVLVSVTSRYRTKTMWDRDSRSLTYDSLASLVCRDQISCRWVRRYSSNKGIKEGYPLRNRYFAAINSSRVRTVVDRHRFANFHHEYCWRAFRGYQHRWPWTTMNPNIGVFSELFAILEDTYFKSELCRNHWK